MDRKGIAFRETMEGCSSQRDVTTLTSFGLALIDTLTMSIKKMVVKVRCNDKIDKDKMKLLKGLCLQ